MNGYEVARQIPAATRGGKVVLVAVTRYGHEDDKLQAKAAGFDHHIKKHSRLKR